jgi:hypothetical protein
MMATIMNGRGMAKNIIRNGSALEALNIYPQDEMESQRYRLPSITRTTP